MSTPISDLPDDIDDIEEDYPVTRRGKRGKLGMLKKHIDLFYIFLAAIAATYVSIDSFRYSVPPQVFTLGDAPIQASITVIMFVLIRLIMKSLM